MNYTLTLELKVNPEAPFLSLFSSEEEEVLERVLNALYDVEDVEVIDSSIVGEH